MRAYLLATICFLLFIAIGYKIQDYLEYRKHYKDVMFWYTKEIKCARNCAYKYNFDLGRCKCL